MATEAEILNDIANIYRKIDQCHRSKTDLAANIDKERSTMSSLSSLIAEDKERIAKGKRARYDEASMLENIERCKRNIALFEKTIATEDSTIARFQMMVSVLQEDMRRPTEIVFDASTGKIIN